MKKFLLTTVAAFIVAMGANAQFAREAKLTNGLAFNKEVKMENAMTKDYHSFVSHKLNAHRAATTTIDGDYILNAANFEADFTASTTFSVVSQNGTITLDQYENNPEFQYNVVLNDFSYAGAKVYGNYNAAQGFIEIPVQTIFTHPTYKEIVISGGYRKGETNVGYGKSIILLVNEDGTMDIDEDIEEEGDYATTGWVSFIPNYEEPGLWNYGFDIAVLKPNATMNYHTTGKSLGGNGSSWAKVSKRVAVEKYDTEMVINGFLGLAPVSVTLEADGKCAIPFGQDMDDYDYGEQDNSYAYGRMRLVGCAIEGTSIKRDYDKEALNGFYNDELMEFSLSEYKEAWTDEDGNHEAGYYYVDDNPDYCRYYAVATAAGSDGAYSMGWCCNTSIAFDQNQGSGISETKASAQSYGKAFNLMGQEVYGNAKGLIIRDGKKFLNK